MMGSGIANLRPGDLVRIRSECWRIVRHGTYGAVAMLDVRGADRSNGGVSARFVLPFEPVECVPASLLPKVVRPGRWRVQSRSAISAATPRPDALRTAVAARFDVIPYQLEPALAVTAGIGCRLLIADEVGLGKTVQAGLIVAELLDRGTDARALVLCPAALRRQWEEELRNRFALAPVILDSTGVAHAAAQLDPSTNPWSGIALAIASVDFIKRAEVMRALEGMVWDVLVLDEAHNLATRSDRNTAAAALALRARTVVMLSATPHSGDDETFGRLCALGDAHDRFPLLFFRRTRIEADLPTSRRTRWLAVRPTQSERDLQAALVRYAERVWQARTANAAGRLAVSVLLRRAASSASSLARSLERRLESLTASQSSTSAQMPLPLVSESDEEPAEQLDAPGLPDSDEERRHLEQLISLAHAAAVHESKVAALLRWVSRVREPVLVFTEYRDTLAHLRRALIESSAVPARIVELHGALTRSEREAAERAFGSGAADLLLATDAASEGLNLHHRCRCVISLETPWSPVRLEQRIGRVDRFGQLRRVHAIQFVGPGTFEASVVRRLLERKQRAAAALSTDDVDPVGLVSAVLTGVAMPSAAQSAGVLPALRRPDLRRAAEAEAQRITAMRRLWVPGSIAERRPLITVLRPPTKPSIFAFEVVVADSDGVPVWETLIGLSTGVATALWGRSDLQRCAAETIDRLSFAARSVALALAVTHAGVWRTTLRTQTLREEAIGAAVRVRHARIAAELLQPGLFDRRAERQSAAQAAVLEEALARCNSRLDALARMNDLLVATPRLRFARLA